MYCIRKLDDEQKKLITRIITEVRKTLYEEHKVDIPDYEAITFVSGINGDVKINLGNISFWFTIRENNVHSMFTYEGLNETKYSDDYLFELNDPNVFEEIAQYIITNAPYGCTIRRLPT